MRPGESQDEWKVQVSKTFGKSSRKKKRWKLRSNILMTPWSWKRGNVELHEAMLIKVDVREIISEKVDINRGSVMKMLKLHRMWLWEKKEERHMCQKKQEYVRIKRVKF